MAPSRRPVWAGYLGLQSPVAGGEADLGPLGTTALKLRAGSCGQRHRGCFRFCNQWSPGLPVRGRNLLEAALSPRVVCSVAPGHELSPRPLPCRISYDPARYPKYLPEAYCLCRGCLTGLFGEEDLRFRSAPVYMPTVILRRTSACAGGRWVYTEEYVTVPVGCTCVPEQEKEADAVNSSMDKQGARLMLGPGDKPGRP
ncbi:interleukin-17D [Panthera uncia]|uniref:interleukin-17D n=1 Tax=Panthera uncia TaxID=29064 RepID=UPI0020FFB324|nr:interleukin-17D [Panthera uncia]